MELDAVHTKSCIYLEDNNTLAAVGCLYNDLSELTFSFICRVANLSSL